MSRRLCAALAAALGLAAFAPAGGAAPQIGTWGFDLAGRDTLVKPGDDFYDYADGAYLKKLVIPPDRSRYGSFDLLTALSETRVHGILEAAAANHHASGEEAKIGAYYRAFMDETRIDALGAAPLAPTLAEIRAANNRDDIAVLMGRASQGFYDGFFGAGIGVDAKDPEHYAIYLDQAGLGLPDRDYYLEPSFAAQKAKYQSYVAQILSLIGWADPQANAKAIVDVETEIAQASWSRADHRDPTKTYNPMTPAELATFAPGFGWSSFFQGAELSPSRVIVQANTAFPKIAQIFATTPLDTLKAWEAFNVADQSAPYLSKPFVDASFDFHGRTLNGQQEQRPRWKRGVGAVQIAMGEAVGKLYVAKYFPPPAKAAAEKLVDNVREALKARIQRVDWMSETTRARALEKLSELGVKIGYPSKWRDYSALTVSDTDLYGDVQRAQAFEWRRELKQLQGPVDKTEWGLTPQTVNAYYNPTRNEIVFPAAILQPPFFDPGADPAVNYGGIGGVIGHEMTHGFDDQGRQFDGHGQLADWWQAADEAKFAERTRRLSDQYSAFEPLPGAHVKGDLTMGENIADLGGVLLALDAYHRSLNGRPARLLNGLTGDQRVFLGWAQVWRSAIRPDTLRRQLVSDPHSPEIYRVNGVLRNVDAWYAAFGVKPGDSLYLAPDQRVRIW